VTQAERRQDLEIHTRRSEGGDIGENRIAGSDRPGQFEGRSEHIHSEGSRHDDRY
jgi:hypothetical protein